VRLHPPITVLRGAPRRRRAHWLAAAGLALALVAGAGLTLPGSGGDLAAASPAPSAVAPAPSGTATRSLGVGEASYYHDSLAGNPTASGAPYRPEALTAAHRRLPLGTRVRVTNLDNGRSVVVEVNDRGPFAKGRVIDLSRAAASRLGMIHRGHTDVRLDLLG